MTTTVIVLIVIGLIFIGLSYMLSEKLSGEDGDPNAIKIPKELTEEQKEKIDNMIRDYMDENVESKLGDIETRLSEIVNQKTLALGDYAVTVNDEIDRNHKEVVFLYEMLQDKQKEIMTTVNMVDDYKKEVDSMVQQGNRMEDQQLPDEELQEAIKEIDDNIISETDEETLENVDASKDVILEMFKSGYSILEIAKQLGLGVGEVKLVVDLYQGDAE